MKERLCLEVERLGLSAVIMGSRGFGAIKRGNNGRLGSVSNYCVRHCVCPVVVVRHPDEKDGGNAPQVSVASAAEDEDDTEFHDASDDRKAVRVEFSGQDEFNPRKLEDKIEKKKEDYQCTFHSFYRQCKKNEVKLEVKLAAGYDPRKITIEEAQHLNPRQIVLET